MKFLPFLLFLFSSLFFSQEKTSTKSENGQIISENFEIPQLNTTRRIWIYLPPNYQKSSEKYPVMYLHDGQNLFDDKTSYAGEWQIDESLNQIFRETGKSVIVVGIDNGGEKRIDELSTFKNEKYNAGGNGENYMKFIVETLKPYIDKNYHTKSNPKNTILGGSSLGALISVYGGVEYAKTFSKILAFSPAFWFNSKEFNEWIQNKKVYLKNQKYYFIHGKFEEEGMDKETLQIIEKLKLKGVKSKNIYFKEHEDGKHNEWFWRREFPSAFLWLTK